MCFIIDITSLLLVSKLKPILPYYLPYFNAFPGVIVPYINPTCYMDMVYLLKLGWRLDIITE
jgi:hypothetical protein